METAQGSPGVRSLIATALGTSGLRRLAAGWTLCSLGSWAFTVALSVYAFRRGGASAVGFAALARMLPAGLAAPFTGLLGDRHSRRDVLVVLAVARAVVLAAAAAAAAGTSLPLVLVFAAVFTALQTGHRPAQAALGPLLASSPQQLAAANAVWNGAENAAFLAGSLVGGVVVAATSVPFAFAVTAGAFALAALVLATIARDPVPAHRQVVSGASVVRDAVAGFGEVAHDRGLRLAVGLLSVATLVEGAIDVLVVVVALDLLGLGASGLGWLNSAWGLGGLTGGGLTLVLLGRGRLAGGLAAGSLLVGGSLAVIAGSPGVAVAVILLFVLGNGYTLIEVAGHSLVQALASDHVLARAFGVVESTYWITTGLGSVLAPVLIHVLGIRGALLAVGAVLPVVAVSRWAALARLEAGRAVPEREFGLLRALPFCAPLPVSTVEALARRVVPVEAPAGHDVVCQGDVGDRFYVVAEGELRVVVDGTEVRRVEAGGFFGEIALLRDVPRTATVTATAPAHLMALERDDFLGAVTGHVRAGGVADEVVESRLSLRATAP